MTPESWFRKTEGVRFWAQVEKTAECWLWRGAKTKSGYGVFTARRRQWRAHRYAWTLANGPIPDEINVLHVCDVKLCVRHLFLGTQADNIKDKVTKNRQARGAQHGSKTHPERIARGTRHGFALHPERVARGERHGRAKLTGAQVLEIRRRLAGTARCDEIANDFGVSVSTMLIRLTPKGEK